MQLYPAWHHVESPGKLVKHAIRGKQNTLESLLLLNQREVYRMGYINLLEIMYSLPTISPWSGRYSGQRVHNFMPWKKLARAVSNAPSWIFLVWKLASSSCFHFGTGFRCATVLKAADSRVKKSFSMYLMYILCTIPQVYGRSFRPFTAFSKSCCLPLPGIV
jgi:hypothetical protein